MLNTTPLLLVTFFLAASSAPAAEPTVAVTAPASVQAEHALGRISLDGRLDEEDWGRAQVATNFVQIEPRQGDTASFRTEVRVLFDDDNLYFGVMCYDPQGSNELRVPDLRRDFDAVAHDHFAVMLDPFGDGRTAMAFEVNPYGAQRDLQVFDDALYDRQWDAIWSVRTQRTGEGWSVELAIPWKTLRFPASSSTWRLQMSRLIRRLNETSGWSPWKRPITQYRMTYAGSLKLPRLNSSPINLQLRPYVVGRGSGHPLTSLAPAAQVGGDAKWAPTPNSVLDLTFNTDFAEADADRQVVNLSRFNVFFPEQRQFFLESASLFSVGLGAQLQPFFSRRIGLSKTGMQIPIMGGARFVSRAPERSWGGLFLRTRDIEGESSSYFGLARYSENLGQSSRLGAIVVVRQDDDVAGPAALNLVPALDGLWRSGPWTAIGMLSGSLQGDASLTGLAGYLRLYYQAPWFTFGHDQLFVDPGYTARTGFVARQDYMLTNPYLYLDWRPSWKPSFIRSFRPNTSPYLYNRLSDGRFQELKWRLTPMYVQFESGDHAQAYVDFNWQVLETPFTPLPGVHFDAGRYQYERYGVLLKSDQSRMFSAGVEGVVGRFYDGSLQQLIADLAARPLPHVTLAASYQLNRFILRSQPAPLLTHLIAPELRIALNAQLQLVSFYQYNSVAQLSSWNARFSWEFRPLSFLYAVYNDSEQRGADGTITRNQQVVVKLTYVGQM